MITMTIEVTPEQAIKIAAIMSENQPQAGTAMAAPVAPPIAPPVAPPVVLCPVIN